jgi:thiamine-phosphate pyrophosphorylase
MITTKYIEKFQFVTIDHPEVSHVEQAIRAYKSGCKWVQLRMKKSPDHEVVEAIEQILVVAKHYNAVLIVNDRVDLVLQTNAHGVHLGQNDMCPAEARKILGPDYIIGGTANKFEQILKHIDCKVDYVGLGPFRFTRTKEKLSEILGIDGYKQIIFKLNIVQKTIPIIGIGGIGIADIEDIMLCGVHGLAVASTILRNNEIENNTINFKQTIEKIGYEITNNCR